MDKISVIIPVIQRANHIDELLSILLIQSEKDIEIICPIAKDSEYMQLLENYAVFDSRIKVLRLENEQQWLSASVEAATADFVIFFRPATVIATAFLQYLLELVNSREDVDFVYAPLTYKDEVFFQDHSLSSVSVEDFSLQNAEGYFTPDAMGKAFMQKADREFFGKLIRRDFLQNLISKQAFTNDETVLFYNCLFKARSIVYTLRELMFEWHFSDPFLPQSYKIEQENIKISVIMPVYNAGKHLARCLDSLVLQTYQNLEFICVNDGSTDGSGEVLQQYAAKDKRFKIITQENKGVSVTRNVALEAVSGDYVSMVDADDFVSLALYQKFAAIVQKEEKQIDLFQFNGLRFFDTNGFNPFLIHVLYHASDWGDFFDGHYHGFYPHVNMADDLIWNKIYRTEWLRQNNIRFAKGLVFEDRLFSLEAHLRAENKYILENYLYFYRQHPNSISHSLQENVFDIFKILEKEEEVLRKFGIFENVKYMFFKYHVMEYWLVVMLTDNKYMEGFIQTARERLQSYMARTELDESVLREGSFMEIYDDIMTLSPEQIRIKHQGAPLDAPLSY